MNISSLQKNIIKFILLVLFLVVFLLFVFLNKSKTVDTTFEQRNFSSIEWRNGDCFDRGTMIDSLLNSDVLLSRTKEEVYGILGHPSDLGDIYDLTYWNYCAQINTPYPVSYQGLTIEFDRGGTVVDIVYNLGEGLPVRNQTIEEAFSDYFSNY